MSFCSGRSCCPWLGEFDDIFSDPSVAIPNVARQLIGNHTAWQKRELAKILLRLLIAGYAGTIEHHAKKKDCISLLDAKE